MRGTHGGISGLLEKSYEELLEKSCKESLSLENELLEEFRKALQGVGAMLSL